MPLFAMRMLHTVFWEKFAPSKLPTLSLWFPFASTYFVAESDWDVRQAEDLVLQYTEGYLACILPGPWQLTELC